MAFLQFGSDDFEKKRAGVGQVTLQFFGYWKRKLELLFFYERFY